MSIDLYNLIALPAEAKIHIDLGCTLLAPSVAGFVSCSCGASFRVGIIVDKTTLYSPSKCANCGSEIRLQLHTAERDSKVVDVCSEDCGKLWLEGP